ncbi:MAG: secretin and TonB N-terminal domain-containing protein, partial [Paraglaciecola sp.]|nr:secretin and TonB N-terminal domain-containing protein [Paraglaciecola sp.]
MSKYSTFNVQSLIAKPVLNWSIGLFLSVWTFSVLSQESGVVLVDTDKQASSVFSSELQDIQFKRMPNGGAQTTLVFSNSNFQMQLSKANNKLTLLLPTTQLAKEQLYKLDVIDFATPVSMLETYQQKASSKVEFALVDEVSFRHQKSGNNLIINIEKMSEKVKSTENSKFAGEPISLDFQDVPVRQVLQIISQVNGFNLVTTDTVTGNVTISLSGVPWDQALDMILKIKGLDKRLEGNILLIAPTEELTARETQQLQAKQQVAELAPLVSTNIQINYAKAIDMASILKNAENTVLTPRGTVSVDDRTNTLLLRDTQLSIDEAKALITALDIPIKQVLIESRMVTVRDNAGQQLGVRWGFILDTPEHSVPR